jgi:hypothetical protein
VCWLLQVESNLQPEGLQPPARDWFGALSSLSSDAELPCDEWIEDPVVVVSRVEYANFYHTMTDFVGAWCVKDPGLPTRPAIYERVLRALRLTCVLRVRSWLEEFVPTPWSISLQRRLRLTKWLNR